MELVNIIIKIREGEDLKLSPEEAKKLQEVLNDIFPKESSKFPFGINKEMDNWAIRNGFSHWSCV